MTATFGLLLGMVLWQAAETPDTAGSWRTRLPNGVTVELLGVAEHPSKNRSWWQPDGSPLAERPYDRLGAAVVVNKKEMAREFAVRLSNAPCKRVSVQWRIDPSSASSVANPSRLGESVPHVHGVHGRLEPGPTAPGQGIEQIVPIVFPCADFAASEYVIFVGNPGNLAGGNETDGFAGQVFEIGRKQPVQGG